MKPVYVFDGKPPALKKEELSRRCALRAISRGTVRLGPSNELDCHSRFEKRGDATEALEEAKEASAQHPGLGCSSRGLLNDAFIKLQASVCAPQTGAEADVEKYSKRTVRVTAQHNEECRRLLQLMGVPVIEVCMSAGGFEWADQLCVAPSSQHGW